MVFCCIAIVILAATYWAFLVTRQLLAGPRKDLAVSVLPTPPRALTGNSAQPVWGHTSMFQKHGGNIALLFPPDWREWKWLPKQWSRPLGNCFSIFIWGQWRVLIRGPENVQRILESPGLKEGWAWSPPVSLLGKSCLPLLPDEEAEFLYSLLLNPLAHDSVSRFAPQFVEAAERYVDELIAGKFDNSMKQERRRNNSSRDVLSDDGYLTDGDGIESGGYGHSCHSNRSSECRTWHHKIKFNGLRSYTLDLIGGPVLGLKICQQMKETSISEESTIQPPEIGDDQTSVQREKLLLWMDRLKRAICVIKLSMGREWMHIWLFSEYGRAINGRMHLEEALSDHVAKRAKEAPMNHASGKLYHDPLVTSIPILTMTENYLNRNQSVTGERNASNRPRARSESFVLSCRIDCETEELKDYDLHGSTREVTDVVEIARTRCRANTSPTLLLSNDCGALSRPLQRKRSQQRHSKQAALPNTILEHMLQQGDVDGNGLTKAVTTELCILLWLIMDAGNAWTAMVLNLLSLDQNACSQVQQELDHLRRIHGKDGLFTPAVLNQMTILDAVLYEAIRLCPSFLGGMKVTSETVELLDCGIQIPKNTNVVFCQPTDEPFDLSKSIGKKPEELGSTYPNPELNGFLPFKGLEVPLLVLQSKIFLVVLLQRCSPFLSKKRTFIRRIKEVFRSKSDAVDFDDLIDDKGDFSSVNAEESSISKKTSSETNFSRGLGELVQLETTQADAMKLFTKIPFPEPRRVINVRERDPVLEILGIANRGN